MKTTSKALKKDSTIAQKISFSPQTNGDHPASPEEQDIRLLAYQKWEIAGMPVGDGQQFWIQAELELTGRKSILRG